LCIVVPKLDAAAIEKGNKQAIDRRRPGESARRQIQLFDHQRMQQSGEISAGRHFHAGKGFFHGAGAADALARLKHQHPLAGPGQISGAGQAVMPAPTMIASHGCAGQFLHRRRQADQSQSRSGRQKVV
jgi:hypothetical protein